MSCPSPPSAPGRVCEITDGCFYEDSFVKPFLVSTLMGGSSWTRTKAWPMRPDPRSGRDERSSQCSDELLSVQGNVTRHPMQHARKVRWQTPITDAPHL